MNRALMSSSILIVAFSLSHCTRGDTEHSPHAFRSYQENDVSVAETTGGPRFSKELFIFRKELSLVQDPGQPESLLNYPRKFFMDADGLFYVEDGGNCRIAVFGTDGIFLRSIGRQGNGPGEFNRYGWRLTSLRGEVLTTYDYSLRRTTRFRTDGILLETIPAPSAVRGADVTYLKEEDLYVVVLDTHEEIDDLGRMGNQVLTISAGGDTVGIAQSPMVTIQYLAIFPWQHPLNQRMWLPMPFTSWPSAQYVDHRGVLMSTGGEPALWWYDLDGNMTGKILLDLPARPVTQRERSAELDVLDKQIESTEGRSMESAQIRRRAIRFPENKAFWDEVIMDDKGFIWLRVPESSEETEARGGGSLYRILSPEGEYLGTTRAPDTGTIMNNRLLGIVRDLETGELIPTVWQILPQIRQIRY